MNHYLYSDIYIMFIDYFDSASSPFEVPEDIILIVDTISHKFERYKARSHQFREPIKKVIRCFNHPILSR
jgi:hypothetical protein